VGIALGIAGICAYSYAYVPCIITVLEIIMRRVLPMILLLLCMVHSAQGQEPTAPDYAVYVVDRQVSVDGETVILQFAVYNIGAASDIATSANLYVETDGDRLAGSLALRPLSNQGDTEILTFEVPTDELPGGNVAFRLEVGIGDLEPAGSPTIADNTRGVVVTIPGGGTPIRRTPAPIELSPTAVNTPEATATATQLPITIPGLPITIDPSILNVQNPFIILGIVALCGVSLILLWVLTVILRLLFRPPRLFETWQPPYAISPNQDPNTLAGRRQMWQRDAQSDALPASCVEGSYHIRKQLVGIDGKNLVGWRVRGLRLSQYDVYGRVARSQALASSSLVRRLDRAARRSSALTEADAKRWVKPIARKLAGQFARNINRRSAMLPIACDIRFRGAHGEARIVFDLFQCRSGILERIDQWEPEMTIVSGAIQENFTYSSAGMYPNEDQRKFRQRVQDELSAHLVALLWKPAAQSPTGDTTPSQPVTVPLTFESPATGDTAQPGT
jgi:hypothetical protein